MCVIWSPISSMCPSITTTGLPGEASRAYEFPTTSRVTSSANASASLRQSRDGAASNPDGPGVSSNWRRNVSDCFSILILPSQIQSTATVVQADDDAFGGSAASPSTSGALSASPTASACTDGEFDAAVPAPSTSEGSVSSEETAEAAPD